MGLPNYVSCGDRAGGAGLERPMKNRLLLFHSEGWHLMHRVKIAIPSSELRQDLNPHFWYPRKMPPCLGWKSVAVLG